MEKINLQLFAEGAEGTSSIASAGEEASENAEAFEESETKEESTPQTDGGEKKAFSELIKNEYKDEFTEEVNRIFSKRYKSEQGFRQKYEALQEKFLPLMERFEAKTPEELLTKLSEDEKRLAEEAMEHGMDAEDYKKFLELKTENRRKTEYIERIEKERIEAVRARAHNEQMTKWYSEAEKVKEEYPDFELSDEVKNQSFLTALRMGVSLKDAYRIAHPDIYKKQIAESERQAARQMMKEKGLRPGEVGAGGTNPAREMPRVDRMTDDELEEIRRRVISGEKISFS